jgi:uncharacterized protein YjbJ (UPF0337 family)
MNSDQIKGNWKQFVGKAEEKCGRLTDGDWKIVEGAEGQASGLSQAEMVCGRLSAFGP